MAADETKKDICVKCNNYFWIDKHHILPKSVFGGEGDIVRLCPNCHRDYHEQLGTKDLKIKNRQFHYDFFAKWMAGGLAILGLLYFLTDFA
ncbi:MAG: hypothetical protein EAZ97_12745 [Bacteroidetes bacterium]|nr:MAG: hypothetical protein EAZ97_12745 [Bacteroidota bacterium]